VLAVALALCASLCWGCSDFIGGLRSRALPVVSVLVVVAPAGLAVLVAAPAAADAAFPGGLAACWAVLAGLSGTVGIVALYRGLAVGRMGIVAPITALTPVVPLVVGLARGERPSAIQYAGMALALTGVVLAAREAEEGALRGRLASGVGWAIAAVLAFGASLVATDAAAGADPYWAVLIQRVTYVAAALVLFTALRTPRPPMASLPLLTLGGCLDATATLCFAVAASKGLLSVVVVLASFYPVVILALAWALLHERLARPQLAGAGMALVGAALLSAG
jgi:drug/metabolite transporter (DMT)-like permease